MQVGALSNGATKRLYIFAAVILFWLCGICLRLVSLQVFAYGDFVQRASRQQQRSIEVAPRRGIIYDRNGHELAMSISVDSVFAVPSEIPDQANTAQLLARVLKADPRELLSRMKGSRNFAWIERKVDAETSERIRRMNLRGIYFQKESKRFYPKRELAAQVLGYVGLDDEGLGGIERSFDKQMKGTPGRMQISVDARRKWFGRVEKRPVSGGNVVLTIDEKIQYIAEKEVDRAMEETKAAAATAIVQNPYTGEILALVNRPTFNPNLFHSVPAAALKNRAVSDIYEPGSTFKIVTLAAALEEKVTTPTEVIDCQMGSIVVNGMRIRDHQALGHLTVSQILQKSSDVGAIKLGLRLGNERFDRYIRAFGYGAQTGIELPGETKGLAKPASRWSKVSVGAISMGQEVGVSALQVAGMVSTIANGGVLTPARLIAGTIEPNAQPQPVVFKPAAQRRVISPLTAVQMKKMMEETVLFGTGRKAILDGYTSAGKTGTAQKTDPTTGAYSHTDYVASFAGFAPVNTPAVTIVVIIDSAKGLHQGGQIASPVFNRIAQQVLEYMNVPHDTEFKNDPQRQLLRARVKEEELRDGAPDHLGAALDLSEVPQYTPPKPETVVASAGRKPSPATVAPVSLTLASSKAPVQKPAQAEEESPVLRESEKEGTVVINVGGNEVVPSFLGMTLRSAIETAQNSGFEINAIGSGVAREQAPQPGERVAAGARIAVRFAR